MTSPSWSRARVRWLAPIATLVLPAAVLASAPPFPPGVVGTTATYTQSVAQPIPDVSTITSTITVSGATGVVWDVDLLTSITHTWNADLSIWLTSPAGTRVVISTWNGGGAANVFNGTRWDDSASTAVTMASFYSYVVASPLIPEQALSPFIGENPNGTWTLTISDQAARDTGTLRTWSLVLTTTPSAPPGVALSSASASVVPLIDGGELESGVSISGGGTVVLGATVTTNIEHTYSGDLTISVRAPSGKTVILSSRNGYNARDVFAGTLWDDRAPVPVTDAAFTSGVVPTSLAPRGALGAFIGEIADGTWSLSVSDRAGGGTGTLNAWSLDLIVLCNANCQSRLALSPTNLSFGTLAVGGTPSAPQTITLRSTGLSALGVANLVLDGPNPNDFLIVSAPGVPFAVQPGSTASVSVAFRPTTFGPRVASLLIGSNDLTQPIAFVALNGTGQTPGSGAQQMVVSPASLFGEAAVGTTVRNGIVISNPGSIALTINSLTLGGLAPSDYLVTRPALPATIAPGGRLGIPIAFTPSASGDRSATLAVAGNDPVTPSFVVRLAGSGVAPVATLGPSALSFGGIPVGNRATRVVAIGNPGMTAVSVTQVQLTGSAAFTLVNPPAFPVTVEPDGSLALTVAYAPTAITSDTGSVQVTTNLSGGGTLDASLEGTGVAELAIDPEVVDFGTVPLKRPARRTRVTLKNLGSEPLAINAVTGTAEFVVDPATIPSSIGPNGTATVEVSFVPAVAGVASGTLTVDTAIRNGAASITLQGAAIATGCGCGAESSAAPLLLGLVALLGLRWRRRMQ